MRTAVLPPPQPTAPPPTASLIAHDFATYFDTKAADICSSFTKSPVRSSSLLPIDAHPCPCLCLLPLQGAKCFYWLTDQPAVHWTWLLTVSLLTYILSWMCSWHLKLNLARNEPFYSLSPPGPLYHPGLPSRPLRISKWYSTAEQPDLGWEHSVGESSLQIILLLHLKDPYLFERVQAQGQCPGAPLPGPLHLSPFWLPSPCHQASKTCSEPCCSATSQNTPTSHLLSIHQLRS